MSDVHHRQAVDKQQFLLGVSVCHWPPSPIMLQLPLARQEAWPGRAVEKEGFLFAASVCHWLPSPITLQLPLICWVGSLGFVQTARM